MTCKKFSANCLINCCLSFSTAIIRKNGIQLPLFPDAGSARAANISQKCIIFFLDAQTADNIFSKIETVTFDSLYSFRLKMRDQRCFIKKLPEFRQLLANLGFALVAGLAIFC